MNQTTRLNIHKKIIAALENVYAILLMLLQWIILIQFVKTVVEQTQGKQIKLNIHYHTRNFVIYYVCHNIINNDRPLDDVLRNS